MRLTGPYPAALVIALVAAGGCSGSSPTPTGACMAAYIPAVEVVPVDSVTGAFLAAGATGSAQTTGYLEPLGVMTPPMDTILYGGYPPGEYQVTIDHPGYQQWVKANIRVFGTPPCDQPRTVKFRAKLQPTP